MWTAFNLVYMSLDNQSSQSGNSHDSLCLDYFRIYWEEEGKGKDSLDFRL